MVVAPKYKKTYHFPNGSRIDTLNNHIAYFGYNGGYWRMDRNYAVQCLIELRKMKQNKPNKIGTNYPYVMPNIFDKYPFV